MTSVSNKHHDISARIDELVTEFLQGHYRCATSQHLLMNVAAIDFYTHLLIN